MNRTEYEANKREKIEKHHILGKINSDEILNLPKNSHDLITIVQNSVPVKYRKNFIVMGISSMIGFFELGVKQLRYLRELIIKDLEDKDGQNN